MRQTRITEHGNVHLPPDLRARLGWREGDQLIIEELDDAMVLRHIQGGGDAAALGEAGLHAAAEVIPVEDFSHWAEDDR